MTLTPLSSNDRTKASIIGPSRAMYLYSLVMMPTVGRAASYLPETVYQSRYSTDVAKIRGASG